MFKIAEGFGLGMNVMEMCGALSGMAMIIAGACAKGTSVINRAEIIFRGYENLPGKLTALGVRNTLAEV